MKIFTDGMYCLTYEDISEMGFSDPSQVKIYGNGGDMLPLMNSIKRLDDLVEAPVYFSKGTDNVFNAGDYLLFYGHGPVKWTYNTTNQMFDHEVHLYSNAAYYFITSSEGNTATPDSRSINGTPVKEITEFDDRSFHEENRYNLLESGRQWLGEKISSESYDTTFIFDNLVTSSPVIAKVNVVSRSSSGKATAIYNNSTLLGNIITGSVILENKTGEYARQNNAIYSFSVGSDEVNLKIVYNKSSSNDEGYLDYITVNARRKLMLTDNVLFFRDHSITGTDGIVRFSLENCTENTEIWDITDPHRIYKMEATLQGTKLSFIDSAKILKEYVAFNPSSSFPRPLTDLKNKDLGFINNQNLHGMPSRNMLIITHPSFIAAADSFAEFHRNIDNLSVAVATTEEIYNEFSSGAQDVSAIRDFTKMVYDRGTDKSDSLKYLLLIGDGSYNNVSESDGNSNYILTYQSLNSLAANYSYVSDDFYGFLEETEGGNENMENFSLDIGIGRLPVKTADEALAIFNKVKNYNTLKNKGDWQNNILFAADDQDANLHMTQANGLADWIVNSYPEFAVKKVLIDAYPQTSSAMGARYPAANQAIRDNIEKGLLIFNYTGHGGETALADEQILTREDIQQMNNLNHLPLFITATCEFSRFDDLAFTKDGDLIESTSAGEYSLLNENGGSIGLLTTTRIVYSSENHDLNTRFYHLAFERKADGSFYALGDLVKMTKNYLTSSRNKLNFILLGDPALKLALPELEVKTDSLNHVSVDLPIDTLKAFSLVTISGHIEDYLGNVTENYNGIIYPSVYDKLKTQVTKANDADGAPMHYKTREDLLFRGKATVINGRFSFQFRVPKDITYNIDKGKIIYFSSGTNNDANGEFSEFYVGGTDAGTISDFNGPDISLYLNDEHFEQQGITNANPVIFAKIYDENGINTIGNGIGHDITGIIDDDATSPILLNEYFNSELDDYTSGTLRYPMTDLKEGMHSLRVKVWDVFNNSSEETIEFRVIEGNHAVITKAFNYPNPAVNFTTFVFQHNRAGEDLNVTVSVYDMQGRIVHMYTDKITTSGFNSSTQVWDLRDMNNNKLKQGIYLYKIRIIDSKGSSAECYQKLVILK